MKKSNSAKCPKCGKTIKAHQGNNKDFVDLNEAEMNSSIGATVINLKRSLKVYAQVTGKPLDKLKLRVIGSIVK